MPDTATGHAILLHGEDNVAIAPRTFEAGQSVLAGPYEVTLSQRVVIGHKLALSPIQVGEPVRKFGQIIGFATKPIAAGEWIHMHNLENGELNREYEYGTSLPPEPEPITGRTFQGYRRANGKAGTRNYIAIISSVNCSASVSKYIAHRFDQSLLRQYPNIDGILPLTHKGGCGMQFAGEDHQQLARVLAGFAQHPNVGGFILVGLGCETASLPFLLEQGNLVQIKGVPAPQGGPPVLTIQECGGTNQTVEAGLAALAEMLPRVNDVRREAIPASELILGTECGGSDGNSGVTANPALGVASDLLVACGGTSILAETPEVYGAEHLLTARAKTKAIGEKLVERIRWWEKYAGMFGTKLDNNPSPGNKAGGLTTIFEKSLGAVAKGGTSALSGVYHYAEPIDSRGFVFMDSPGYDPASITGMVASGANVVAFTTGRGSCFGCKPVPSIKIATNTPMFERMQDDMDVDAGVILNGATVEEVGHQIFDLMLEVASGRKTKSELHGVGEEEFAPWSVGPTL